MATSTKLHWDWEISSRSAGDRRLSKLLSYRHLVASLIRRDFLVNYRQTVLGPFWILLQPLLTLLIYLFLFDKVMRLPIGKDVPPALFYFCGIVLWNFYNDTFGITSRTFRENAHLFSKVYFPRIIVPLANVGTQFLRFCVQLLLLLGLCAYYATTRPFSVNLLHLTLSLVVCTVLVALIGLSAGLFFAVATARYRDLSNFVDLCLRLLIFVTPVFYSLAVVNENIRWVVTLNPLTPVFELFRFGFAGYGEVTAGGLAYSAAFAVGCFGLSYWLFTTRGPRLLDVI